MQHIDPTPSDIIDPHFNPHRLFQHDAAPAAPQKSSDWNRQGVISYTEDGDFLGVSDYVNPRSVNYNVVNPSESAEMANKRSMTENILIGLGGFALVIFVLDGVTNAGAIQL